MDVLVVGAGPVGLALAVGLAAQGVDVQVVDRAAGPSVTSRANILHARGVEVLERLGALGDLRARSLAPVGMRMHVGGELVATMRFAPDPKESVQALFVSQATIEAELRRRLAELDTEIRWDTQVTTIHQDADGVAVGFGNGTAERASWVVGCDGAQSTVRGLAGIGFPGVPVAERFLLADVRTDWERDRTTSASWYHREGMLLAIPMPGAPDLWRLMADAPHDGERLETGEIVAQLHGMLAERAGATDVRIHETAWASVFRIHRRLADDYRRGRILLAGDAAHIHSPIGGQGMNTGIGDAENLAWKLGLVVRGHAQDALLDTYAAERRPLAAEVLRNTTANTRILLGENGFTRFLRDRLLLPLLDLPAVQRNATRTASQLWASYRKGPLGGRGRSPRPGDRVPDRRCTRADGDTTRLTAELGPVWALLAAPEHDVGDLLDTARAAVGPSVVLLRNADEPANVLLVRPDGHLAWRGSTADALRDWLTGVGMMRP